MRKNQYDKYVADTGGKMSKEDWDSIKSEFLILLTKTFPHKKKV